MQANDIPFERVILICRGEGPEAHADCGGANPKPVADALAKAVQDAGLAGRVSVMRTTCMGLCEKGPNVMVFPEGKVFSGVRPVDVPAIVGPLAKPRT